MRYAVLVSALALAACSKPTELLLTVEAVAPLSFGTGGDIDSLRILAQPAADDPNLFFYSRTITLCAPDMAGATDCQPQQYVGVDYKDSLTLPIRFLLSPGDTNFTGKVRVWVNALKTGYAQQRLSEGFLFQFVQGRRLWLDLPLYDQCLDDLTCQAADEICNEARDCQMIQPSLTPPVDDLAPAPPDLTPPPADMAFQCGIVDHACCAGGMCNPGLSCGTNGACFVLGQCGGSGAACCTSDAGQPFCTNMTEECVGGTCQTKCTTIPTDSCAMMGLACIGGVCSACGMTAGSPCCQGTCRVAPLSCVSGDLGMGGTCQTCGTGAGAPCCTGSDMGPCVSGYSCGANNQCTSCGGAVGHPCCANGACGVGPGDMAFTCSTPGGPGSCEACMAVDFGVMCCPNGVSATMTPSPAPQGLLHRTGAMDAPLSAPGMMMSPSCL